jgi:hypothetical protein
MWRRPGSLATCCQAHVHPALSLADPPSMSLCVERNNAQGATGSELLP